MPSKRKKNKRRMRRVQAQRRALEEQHAANPPIKASPGIAVSAPPTATTPKKVPKTAAPPSEKTVPITIPIVETPKVEPKPVVPEPVAEPVLVEVAVTQPDVKLLLQVSAEVEVEAHVEADVEAQAHVAEEPLGGWTPPVEPTTDEAGVGKEAEPNVPETEPVNEVKPFGVPAATEIQTVDTVSITETELIQPETEDVAEIFSGEIIECKVELEVAITEEISAPEPVKETREEPAVDLSDQVSAEAGGTQTDGGSVVDSDLQIPKPEQVTESISPAAPTQETQEEVVVEVSAEENRAAVQAEPVTTAEDAPVQSVEIPEVKDAIPEASVETDEVIETKAGLENLVADDAAVTEPVSAVEGAVTAAADIQQEFVATSDNFSTQKESMDASRAYPEPVAAPAVELTSDAAKQTCLNVSSEEPKSEACDTTCHMQLPVESVELSSVEISVETTLNGHIVPEVSIEG